MPTKSISKSFQNPLPSPNNFLSQLPVFLHLGELITYQLANVEVEECGKE
jgi:hypothetical protein